MKSFTEQDLIDMELERRSCIDTANEMSRGDACIEWEIQKMVTGLQTKAQHIQEFQDWLRLNPEYSETLQKISDAFKKAK